MKYSRTKFDLTINPPIMNAAGTLGLTPNRRGLVDLSRLGVFITNPLSAAPRTPTSGTRWLSYPGGFLLHTGLPNPGLRAAIRSAQRAWSRAGLPIWVHLLVQDPNEITGMIRSVENLEGVTGIELGLPPDSDAALVEVSTRAANGELPVVVRLPLEHALDLAKSAVESGAVAISLAPPRGVLPDQSGHLIGGRLYGPNVFPQALAVVHALAQQNIPVIGAGGVYCQSDVEAMRSAGALAVQLDAVLWRGDFPEPGSVARQKRS